MRVCVRLCMSVNLRTIIRDDDDTDDADTDDEEEEDEEG